MPKVKRICPVCGKEFEVFPCKIKRGGGKYCSKECSAKAQRNKVEVICSTCGKHVYLKPCQVKINKTGVYRCPECQKKRNEWVTKKCPVCGKEFEGPKHIMINKKYCSQECYHAGRYIGKNKYYKENDYMVMEIHSKSRGETYKCLIDIDDYEKVNKYAWNVDRDLYVVNRKNGRLHNFLIKHPNGTLLDHINRNPLDNRKENLRLATPSQNCLNRTLNKTNKAGHRGVRLSSDGYGYEAYLKRKYLGFFKTIEEAIEARLKAEQDDLLDVEYYPKNDGSINPTKNNFS